MDSSERWTINSGRGTNLLQTLTHEIGHSLGLYHSDVRDSVMAPFYRGFIPGFSLGRDDVKAVQALYGPHKAKPRPAPPPRRTGATASSATAIRSTPSSGRRTTAATSSWALSTGN